MRLLHYFSNVALGYQAYSEFIPLEKLADVESTQQEIIAISAKSK
jgi:hypothetical protein